MHKLPQMTSIAELRNNHLRVFGLLEKGPVVINSRSQPVGVLVAPQQWDRLMQLLEDQQDIIDALEAKLEIATGQDEYITLTKEEIAAWAAEDELVPG
ncbi:MAG: type II toxin-antitoxin system prevent-host-death family antitoxin [Caldilineaceae bacterium]